MNYTMNLNIEPFNMICNGSKTIELRLYDKKRRAIKVGDTITFLRADNSAYRIEAEVIALHIFPTFKELYASLPLTKCGYTGENAAQASPDDMLKYYPGSSQQKTGVVGIEIRVTGRSPIEE